MARPRLRVLGRRGAQTNKGRRLQWRGHDGPGGVDRFGGRAALVPCGGTGPVWTLIVLALLASHATAVTVTDAEGDASPIVFGEPVEAPAIDIEVRRDRPYKPVVSRCAEKRLQHLYVGRCIKSSSPDCGAPELSSKTAARPAPHDQSLTSDTGFIPPGGINNQGRRYPRALLLRDGPGLPQPLTCLVGDYLHHGRIESLGRYGEAFAKVFEHDQQCLPPCLWPGKAQFVWGRSEGFIVRSEFIERDILGADQF